jgi:hypothetical protein
MAFHVEVSNSEKSGLSLFKLVLAAKKDKCVFGIKQSSHPSGKTTIKRNAKTSLNHALLHFLNSSHINDNNIFVFRKLFNLLRSKMLMFFFVGDCRLVERRLCFIYFGIVPKISRWLWHVCKHFLYEFALVRCLKSIV